MTNSTSIIPIYLCCGLVLKHHWVIFELERKTGGGGGFKALPTKTNDFIVKYMKLGGNKSCIYTIHIQSYKLVK